MFKPVYNGAKGMLLFRKLRQIIKLPWEDEWSVKNL